MAEEAQRPGKTVKLKRLPPEQIIASQLISINAHLASIASNIQYLTEVVKQEQKHVD